MVPGLDLYCADPAQPLSTACEELDLPSTVDHDLSEVCMGEMWQLSARRGKVADARYSHPLSFEEMLTFGGTVCLESVACIYACVSEIGFSPRVLFCRNRPTVVTVWPTTWQCVAAPVDIIFSVSRKNTQLCPLL